MSERRLSPPVQKALERFASRLRGRFDEVAGMAADAGLLDDACIALSPFVRSPEAFEELRRRELRIARDIDREGIPL